MPRVDINDLFHLERAMTPEERKQLRVKLRTKKTGHAWRPGTGPEGETCKTCKHLVRKQMSKVYLKCGLMRAHWTGGGGTDVRAGDPACREWSSSVGQWVSHDVGNSGIGNRAQALHATPRHEADLLVRLSSPGHPLRLCQWDRPHGAAVRACRQALGENRRSNAIHSAARRTRHTMHVVSNKSMQRPGYKYADMGGTYIGWPSDVEPSINWKHIDGPLLYTSDCGLHWLTYWERIQMFFGWTDIKALDRKHLRAAQ